MQHASTTRPCCMPRTPKTGSQSFWNLGSKYCSIMVAGHLVVNTPPPVLAMNSSLPLANRCSSPSHSNCIRTSDTNDGNGNAHDASHCPRASTRLTLVRDPAAHFASMVAVFRSESSRHEGGYLCGLIGLERARCAQASTRSALARLDIKSLQAVLPEYFDNLQTRYLLGFSIRDVSGWRNWARSRSSSEIRRAVEIAVADYDFIGITDDFDATLAAAEQALHWRIASYEMLLHRSDHMPGSGRRLYALPRELVVHAVPSQPVPDALYPLLRLAHPTGPRRLESTTPATTAAQARAQPASAASQAAAPSKESSSQSASPSAATLRATKKANASQERPTMSSEKQDEVRRLNEWDTLVFSLSTARLHAILEGLPVPTWTCSDCFAKKGAASCYRNCSRDEPRSSPPTLFEEEVGGGRWSNREIASQSS